MMSSTPHGSLRVMAWTDEDHLLLIARSAGVSKVERAAGICSRSIPAISMPAIPTSAGMGPALYRDS